MRNFYNVSFREYFLADATWSLHSRTMSDSECRMLPQYIEYCLAMQHLHNVTFHTSVCLIFIFTISCHMIPVVQSISTIVFVAGDPCSTSPVDIDIFFLHNKTTNGKARINWSVNFFYGPLKHGSASVGLIHSQIRICEMYIGCS